MSNFSADNLAEIFSGGGERLDTAQKT